MFDCDAPSRAVFVDMEGKALEQSPDPRAPGSVAPLIQVDTHIGGQSEYADTGKSYSPKQLARLAMTFGLLVTDAEIWSAMDEQHGNGPTVQASVFDASSLHRPALRSARFAGRTYPHDLVDDRSVNRGCREQQFVLAIGIQAFCHL